MVFETFQMALGTYLVWPLTHRDDTLCCDSTATLLIYLMIGG